ncbi:MAG: hypothetical protein GX601_06845, partial [Anaerolineales bacterium]|nr:hypothetical protein [Anaerolineales bacterium]
WLLVAGLAALVITYWPTSSHLVYEKNLEVSGPFNPHEYHALLSGQAAAEDLVVFNELALAGWYELDRGPADPPWHYALRWTPIIEPMPQIRPRVEQAVGRYPRLWFVLYKGSFGPGRELKDWLDGALYPVTMDWGSESLFLSYIAPTAPMVEVSPGADFGDGLVRLEAARYSAQAGPRGELAVSLRWQALTDTRPNCRVVIQVWDEQGQVLAHRDVRPANWEQPSPRWRQGDVVEDRHGLLLTGRSGTPLHLAVSLYDEDTGQTLVVRGQDYLELGTLTESRP